MAFCLWSLPSQLSFPSPRPLLVLLSSLHLLILLGVMWKLLEWAVGNLSHYCRLSMEAPPCLAHITMDMVLRWMPCSSESPRLSQHPPEKTGHRASGCWCVRVAQDVSLTTCVAGLGLDEPSRHQACKIEGDALFQAGNAERERGREKRDFCHNPFHSTASFFWNISSFPS